MRALSIVALAFGLLVAAGLAPVGHGVAQEAGGPSGVVHRISASQPRDFGYFPGDIITREVFVAVDGAYRLQPASIPTAGALNYWLDLKDVAVKEDEAKGERRYLITLTYQTFYVPLEVKRRNLPGFTLQFASEESDRAAREGTAEEAQDAAEGETGKDEAAVAEPPAAQPMASAHIPQWSFLMSPLREIQSTEPPEGPAGFLKPDRRPEPLDLERLTVFFATSGMAAALFLVVLAHHYAWGPFRHRPSRPFTVAARRIKARLRAGADAENYRGALLALHRAFDETAGHRVFAEDMPAFLEEHGDLRSHAEEIGRFYEASRLAFFKGDSDAARSIMPLPDISALAGTLGSLERRS
ncbi:MAG: nonribosomal peptide synthetase MxaA [Methyloligella sp. ZOD6]